MAQELKLAAAGGLGVIGGILLVAGPRPLGGIAVCFAVVVFAWALASAARGRDQLNARQAELDLRQRAIDLEAREREISSREAKLRAGDTP